MTTLLDRARAHRAITASVLALGLAVAGLGAWLFQPWLLLVDSEVDEAFPTVAEPLDDTDGGGQVATDEAAASDDADTGEADRTDTDAGDATAATAPGPTLLLGGSFIDRSHATSGTVGIYELPDGGRVLRIEDLQTDNGPDLFVYLTAASATDGSGEVDDTFVDLGRLKGNQGNQNYDIPADVNLSQFSSIAIWCDRFDVLFGAADLV